MGVMQVWRGRAEQKLLPKRCPALSSVSRGRLLSAAAAIWFLVYVVVWIHRTRSWPLDGDAALIRYVVEAMRHQEAPYRQIRDINEPGAYFLDWLVLRVLGPSALAFRIYDSALLVVGLVAMCSIAGKANRLYGWCGGLLFALFHAKDGFQELGQRDLSLAVLLLCSMAFAKLACDDKPTIWPRFMCGLSIGCAITIKPVALMMLLVVIPILARQRYRNRWAASCPIVAGFLIPVVAMVGFLLFWHALAAFIQTMRVMVPVHAKLGAIRPRVLLSSLFSPAIGAISILALVGLLVTRRAHYNSAVVTMGGLAGLFCYLFQMRGYNYHRYPFIAAMIATLSWTVPQLIGTDGWKRIAGYAIAAYCVVLCPLLLKETLKKPSGLSVGLSQMQADVDRYDPTGTIQCIDSVDGCLAVLVRMNRLQVTGQMYDEFLFNRALPELLQRQKDEFVEALIQKRPEVIVVTKGLFPRQSDGYDKLEQSPALEALLSSCYRLAIARDFAATQEQKSLGYRLYQLVDDRCPSGI